MRKQVWVCGGDHLGIVKCRDCPRENDCDLAPTWIEISDPNPLDFIIMSWTWVVAQLFVAILFEYQVISFSGYLMLFLSITAMAWGWSKIFPLVKEAYGEGSE